jgi:heme exporter protein D
MPDFLSMGGYAQEVWTAFGVTAVVLIGNLLAARRRQQQTLGQLKARLNRQLARRTSR